MDLENKSERQASDEAESENEEAEEAEDAAENEGEEEDDSELPPELRMNEYDDSDGEDMADADMMEEDDLAVSLILTLSST